MCLEIDDQFKRKNDVYGDPYPVKNRRNCDSHDLQSRGNCQMTGFKSNLHNLKKQEAAYSIIYTL